MLGSVAAPHNLTVPRIKSQNNEIPNDFLPNSCSPESLPQQGWDCDFLII